MISERLYDLAFQYKGTKLWKKIGGAHVFAVKLPHNRIGYISVMRDNGEFHGVYLYIGDEGFWTFWNLWKAGGARFYNQWYLEEFMELKCLNCSFEGKDGLSAEEYEEARAYARSHGIKLGGKYAYPRFWKSEPYCVPWNLQTEDEADCLCQGLSAAVWMAEFLEKTTEEEFYLEEINGKTKEIPMLELKNGVYALTKTRLPKDEPPRWPEPVRYNEVAAANMKRAKKQGIWQCEIIRFMEPVQDGPEEIPNFPVMLLTVESDSGYVLPATPMEHYEKNPEELLNGMLEAFAEQRLCPEKLEVRDERTFALVKMFSEKMGILVAIKDDLPELEDARVDFLEKMNMSPEERADEFIKMLNLLADTTGGKIPEKLIGQIGQLTDLGFLPEGLLEMLEDKKESRPKKKAGKTRTKETASESYVISVSLGRGCYRHIRVSGKCTLWDLHCAILEAFEFDDDHAHAFFMDNVKWSDRDSYYTKDAAEGERTTEKSRIGNVGLYKGKAFKYVFDFGDEWTFQCKVLKVEQGDSGEPQVIRSKGEAPCQYGDDEWDDE